jgi:hypothetical protein
LAAGFPQKVRQQAKALSTQMAQLFAMGLLYGFIEPGKQL